MGDQLSETRKDRKETSRLEHAETQEPNSDLAEIGRMIHSMIDEAKIFCDKRFSVTDD